MPKRSHTHQLLLTSLTMSSKGLRLRASFITCSAELDESSFAPSLQVASAMPGSAGKQRAAVARKYTQQIGTADGEQVGRKRKENASFIDAGVQEASTAEVQLAAYPINTEDVSAATKACAKRLRAAKTAAARQVAAATAAQCSVDRAESMADMANLHANLNSLSALLSKRAVPEEPGEPSSGEKRWEQLGALRAELGEMSTDLQVNGIADHLVTDLTRKEKAAAPAERAPEAAQPETAQLAAMPAAASPLPSLRPGAAEADSPQLDNDLQIAARTPGGTSLVSMLGKTPLKTPRTRAALSFVDVNVLGGFGSPGMSNRPLARTPKSALKRPRYSEVDLASPLSALKAARKAARGAHPSPIRGMFGLSGAPVIPNISLGDVTINLNTFGLPEVRIPSCLPR